jgi:ubiquinone/menaquinone biosynthesis C-methylase UbiE
MQAQTIEAARWWANPRGERNGTWIETYQKSLAHRHRDLIVSIVGGLEGVTSVLEVGSHCGPNLVRLARAYPQLEQLSGVDVNADAVAAGQRWVQGLGLSSRIELATGRVPDVTDSLPDGCVDVVLSCYALAYIAPQDLDAVLYEMGRLAKRAIVLAEPMPGGPGRPSQLQSEYHEWAHDYHGASKWIASWRGCATRVEPISPPVDRLNGVLVAVRNAGNTP